MAFRRIYEEANVTYDHTAASMDLDEDTGTKTHMSRNKKSISGVQHLGLDSAGTRLYRRAAVCLGLLCVLLLTVIIVLSVKHTAARNQLQSSNNNLTKGRDQLQTSNTNLTKERDQLQTSNTYLTTERDQFQTSNTYLTKERDQLQTSNIYLTKERDQLQTSNTYLTKERDQFQTSNTYLNKERDQLETSNTNLTKERNEFQKRLSYCQRHCPDEWMAFGSRCYYISIGVKTWSQSRQDCRERGADLVIINGREEQMFISELKKTFWIGLSDSGTEGTWEWVDDTSLNITYWESGQPNSYGGEQDCVEITGTEPNPLKNWNDERCSTKQKWICEN